MIARNSVILVLLIIADSSNAANFPKDIQRCNYGDSKCLSAVITRLIQTSPKGIPSLNIGPLDPLTVEKTSNHIEKPFFVEFNSTDDRVVGIRKGVISNVVGFDEDPTTSKFEIHGSFPHLTISGDYTLSVMLFGNQINREGQFTISFYDNNFRMKFVCSTARRNSQLYLQIENIIYASKISRMTVILNDPLLDTITKQQLGQSAVKKLSDNAFADVLKRRIQRAFDKFPYQEMFNN